MDTQYTAEQLAQLKARADKLGPERLCQVEQVEWPALIVVLQAAVAAGVAPPASRLRYWRGDAALPPLHVRVSPRLRVSLSPRLRGSVVT